MRGRFTILTMLFSGIAFTSIATDTTAFVKDSIRYASPQVEGMPSGKGLEIRAEYITPFHINSTSYVEGVQGTSGTVHRNLRREVKLKFPVWNQPSLKFVLGGSYSREDFDFEKNTATAENPLFKNLEDKPLKLAGITLYGIKSFDEVRFLALRAGYRLQGDYSTLDLPWSEFARYSFALMYGWNKSETMVIATGLNYTDLFGRRSIIPVLMYNKTFNSRWGIESTLPVELKLRNNLSKSTIAYLGAEVSGAKYNIRLDSPLFPKPSVFFSQSEVRLTARLEQKIFWWVWVSVEAGGRYNINSEVTEKDVIIRSADHNLVKNELGTAAIFMGNLFIRPNDIGR